MLHIVCLILKIIGILLVAVLGLVLFTVFLILIVPVRIGAEGSFYERPAGTVRITWLFHLFSVCAEYKETLSLRVRVFGIRLVDDTGEMEPEPETGKETMEKPEAESLKTGSVEVEKGLSPDPVLSAQEWKKEQTERKAVSDQREPEKKRTLKKKRPRFGLAGKMRGILCHVGKSISGAILGLLHGFKTAEERYKMAVDFWVNEENRKSIRLIRCQCRRLVHHIRPRNMRGEVTFGMEDSYRMGQLLSAAAFLYPLYGEKVTVMPRFDKTMLEGEIAFQLRLRFGTLLALAGRLWMDRTIRGWCKKMINRGGR